MDKNDLPDKSARGLNGHVNTLKYTTWTSVYCSCVSFYSVCQRI